MFNSTFLDIVTPVKDSSRESSVTPVKDQSCSSLVSVKVSCENKYFVKHWV